MGYAAWLEEQSDKRQKASLDQLALCIRLGHLDRTDPYCDEALGLRKKIAEYYRRHEA